MSRLFDIAALTGTDVRVEDAPAAGGPEILNANPATLADQIGGVVGNAVDYGLDIVGAVVILLVGMAAAGLAYRWVRSGLQRVPGIDQTIVRFLAGAIRYAILIIVLIAVLAQFGVQTTSIIAAIGAAGLAIGLALQGTLANIAAGIMLLVLRPFRVGDYITAGQVAGTVEEIGLFVTELTTWDGIYVSAPNNQIWNSVITNYSRNPTRLVELTVRISFADDPEKAKAILLDLARADRRVLAKPEPRTLTKELGESSLVIALRCWTATVDYWAVLWDMTQQAKLAFDRAGISIPYPQTEMHIVERAPDAGAAPAQAEPTSGAASGGQPARGGSS